MIVDPTAPANDTDAWKGSYVYYGNYNGSPVKYRVLDASTTDFSADGTTQTMLLDCDSILYYTPFDGEEPYSNVWKDSPIYTSLNGDGFLNKAGVFTTAEKNAIAASNVNSHALTTDSATGVNVTSWIQSTFANYVALTGEQIFLLDAEDVSNGAYGYSMTDRNCENRKKTGSSAAYWWLRSAYGNDDTYVGCVHDGGSISSDYVSRYDAGVSPALNLNLSSVLFSSVISGTAGETGAEYKLTLLDGDMTIAASGDVTRNGKTVTVPYSISGTNSANATQVAVLVLDKEYTAGNTNGATVLDYQRLNVDSFSTSGTGSFTLPDSLSGKIAGTDYHIYIVAEDVNEEKETDYASEPVKVEKIYLDISEATAVQNGTLTYDGTAQTPTFTVTLGNTTLTADDYDVTVTAQTNAGNYTATITGKGNCTGTISNVIWSIGKASVTVTAKNYTVKFGNPLPESLEYETDGLMGTDTLESIGANVTIGYRNAVIPSAIGNYTIVVSGAENTKNYELNYVNGNLTIIAKNAQTITANDVTLSYGDTGKKIGATTSGDGAITYAVASGDDVISVAADGTITALKAGTATVEITAAETFDFAKATKTVTVTVNKKKVAVPTADTTEYTYTGTAQTYGVTSTDDYTVEGGVQTNAGEYPITITLNNENYEWDGILGTYKFVINKAAVTVTAKSYTIKVGEALPTYAYDVAGLVNGETLPIDVTISCNAADSNTAGKHTITVSGAANSTNYTFAYVNGTLTITEKEIQTITAADVTFTYGETGKKIAATTSGDGAISYSTTSDVISIAADGTITVLKAGTATVTITAAETADYAEATKTISVTVNKKKVAVPAADATEYTYNGKAQTYGVTSTDDYTVEGGVQTNAGEYPITITLNNENFEWDGVLGTYKFVINKAAVTVTAKSYTIKVGEALPTYAYDVAGLVNGETLPIDVTISCNAADSNTAGTYDIIVSGADTSDNYTFSYVKGTLTVSEKEVVAAPTFTPASGTTFTSSQKVTISCATAGAKIYYTTDGTEPTTASTLYNGAFTITTTTTIKAIAVKDGMTDSTVVTATYTKKSSGGGGGGGGYRPTTPTTTNPSISGSAKSWSDVAADLGKLTNGTEVTIQLNGNTTVPVEVIKAIDDRQLKVTFVVDSVKSWKTDGAEITAPAAADLSIIATSKLKTDVLRGISGYQFSTNNTNIPTDLEIAFKTSHAGKFANLYKSVDGKLAFVTCAKLGEDGKVILPDVVDKGEYVVMLCEFSDRLGDMDNDGIMNAKDASAILKDIVEIEPGKNPLMADFNGDGKVNAMDAAAILKRIVGLA